MIYGTIYEWKEGYFMRFKLETEYITLAQLLKVCDVISSGGQAKEYLNTNILYVNGIEENRRGRKIPGRADSGQGAQYWHQFPESAPHPVYGLLW